MSAAPAAAPAEGEAPKKGPKKLIIIIAAVVLLLVLGGGGAFFMMKKKAAEAEAAAAAEEEDGGGHAKPAKEAKKPEHGKGDHAAPPAFVPLEPFVVNLADRDSERFAQVGITLQVDDAKMSEEMKAYMPAIRNAILLILSHKSSEELLSQEGKQKLAEEIRRDAARAMGYEIEDPEEEDAAAEDTPKKKKKKKKKVESYNPIVQVHYANFIIQ
ncbi:MAG TPA: flagellar basal body-associated FliL family protein [Aquabacterium sp.]|uniref:flagellar basal body-associated FliL family protein n=1 Tax=Aquabacterium sp. TaxID=1872578 RepID=UPI002E35F4BF|nr:flagellar basal body-associated FliL family protein [Aquabacterium sp.]HEX5356453.1 flagellar basal body-associated FliL family protein [Aquabacterium sp.]